MTRRPVLFALLLVALVATAQAVTPAPPTAAWSLAQVRTPASAGDVVNLSLVLTRPGDPRIAALAPDHVLRSVRELIA